MGDLNVTAVRNQDEQREFMQYVLKDLQAFEYMLKEGWFESDIVRIGAEQEMCLIDEHRKPALISMEALEKIKDDDFTTELAMFNIEMNLDPQEFKGKALTKIHTQLKTGLERAQKRLSKIGADIVLSGILPTIRKSDVELDKITPLERYRALMSGLQALRGELFELRIKGIDELNIRQESAMLESCNTSFQVHLQIKPEEFVSKYNASMALCAPVMAVAVNSPLLFGRRLWKETRIALFQQSLDIRTFTEHLRDRSPRVTFGNDWLKNSILEIYQDDIARFQVLLSTDIDEDVFDKIKNGVTPKLRALNIHNSTVYRWNRPCYGISGNGKPHMRIENRVLPAGPSLPDEMANASFWLGLMNGIEDEVPDVRKAMTFSDAKNNFFAAARFGLDNHFTWFNGKKIAVRDLVLKQLLPIARNGLEKAKIDKGDIDKYLGIIEERTKSGRTGAQWKMDSYTALEKQGATRDEISSAITDHIFRNQQVATPVHKWKLATMDESTYAPSELIVEEFMSTDIISVKENDGLDLVANLMNWRHIRHLPVEDDKGQLVGLITARMVMRHFAQHPITGKNPKMPTVSTLMVKDPVAVAPTATIIEAMDIMRDNMFGSLPVVKNNQLIGMITETEFLNITRNLLRRLSKK